MWGEKRSPHKGEGACSGMVPWGVKPSERCLHGYLEAGPSTEWQLHQSYPYPAYQISGDPGELANTDASSRNRSLRVRGHLHGCASYIPVWRSSQDKGGIPSTVMEWQWQGPTLKNQNYISSTKEFREMSVLGLNNILVSNVGLSQSS